MFTRLRKTGDVNGDVALVDSGQTQNIIASTHTTNTLGTPRSPVYYPFYL